MKNKDDQAQMYINSAFSMLKKARNSRDRQEIKRFLSEARLRIDIAIDNL